MRITRLLLRNYRVYEDEVEIEIPPGLVGVYGPNGAGKSYLIESIPWTLYGATRTTKDDVRTSGVNGECVTELEFEHEGHLYVVRRTITGQNNTVKAEAHADNAQVAEGVRDTNSYVQSILGMDVAAFKSSVFAEQKQIASFSNETPARRRDLVLRLLGIMPLDIARDNAKSDARQQNAAHDQARRLLPDLAVLQNEAENALLTMQAAEPAVHAAQRAFDVATREQVDAEQSFETLDAVRQQHDRLLAEGKNVAAERNSTAALIVQLRDEIAGLDSAQAQLHELEPIARELPAAEARLQILRQVAEAELALAALPPLAQAPPPPPDESTIEAAQAEATERGEAVAALNGEIAALHAEGKRAADSVKRSSELTGEADCPVCGQELGDSFEAVRSHREAELETIVTRLHALETHKKTATAEASWAKQRVVDLSKIATSARQARQTYDKALALHDAAAARVDTARRSLPEPVADVRLAMKQLRVSIEAKQQARDTAARLRGRLERRPMAEASLVEQQHKHEEADRRRDELLAEVRSIQFDLSALEIARVRREATRRQVGSSATAHQQALHALTTAQVRAEAAASRLADGHAQHLRLDTLADDARHVSRLADLLGTFRNAVVSTVGPTLAAHAGDLFAELTDREYDQLEVDPDTYEIRITDAGRTYGMGRFSGSETDLANLALRVAISENVRLQSGGAVGLLVLDEVFGPLDDERRERMLFALERLKARFRQILVVTHANDVKEQLPSAIEVVKKPGRRATARLLVSA